MHMIEDQLKSLPSLPSLPNMRSFKVYDITSIRHQMTQIGSSAYSPSLMKTMPSLVNFYCYNNLHKVNTLSTTELAELRGLCPNIQSLMIDISYDSNWPFEVLEELVSNFEKLSMLTLRVHTATPELMESLFTKPNCHPAFQAMAANRKTWSPGRNLHVELRPVRFNISRDAKKLMPALFAWVGCLPNTYIYCPRRHW
jgi:hypothetical protein